MDPNKTSIRIIPILKDAVSLYRRYFALIISLSLLAQLSPILENYYVLPSFIQTILLFAGSFFSFWCHLALMIAVAESSQDQTISIKEAFLRGKNRIWRFIGVVLIYDLLALAGFLLLVIPGFYLGIIFLLAPIFVALEDAALFESFKKSRDLLRGNFGAVFLITLILTLLSFCSLLFGKLPLSRIWEHNLILLFCTFFFSFLCLR